MSSLFCNIVISLVPFFSNAFISSITSSLDSRIFKTSWIFLEIFVLLRLEVKTQNVIDRVLYEINIEI